MFGTQYKEVGAENSCLSLVPAAGLGFAFSGLVSNRLDSLNKTGWERGSREQTGTSSPFSPCRHGSMPELSELHGYGATSLHSRSQGYGEREEGKGVQSWGFPMGVTAEKGGDHGRPWLAAGELAGISARATRWIGEAWVR